MTKIVAGVDESDASRNALRWALEEARLRQVPVLALHAWEVPVVPLGPVADLAPTTPPIDLAGLTKELADAAEQFVRRVVEEVAGNEPDVEVRPVAVEDAAASALVAAAEPDDLLVVGSHGKGGLVGLLLGSVSHAVVNRARCPVVVHRRG
jgi:nucleotide-binding universal stress UspA family protein